MLPCCPCCGPSPPPSFALLILCIHIHFIHLIPPGRIHHTIGSLRPGSMAAAQLRHLQRLASRLVGTRASGRVGGFTFSTVQRASHRAAARTSWAAVAVPAWQGRRPITVSAVDEGRAGSSSGAAAAADGEQADLQLPTHCSGCGVELQQADPEGPGWVLPAARWAATTIHSPAAFLMPAWLACCCSTSLHCCPIDVSVCWCRVCCRFFQVPKRLLERRAAAAAGAGEEEEEFGEFEEDDSEIVFDDVGPEVR